jgi:predicted enzyme related to lactoylglutathione lyase
MANPVVHFEIIGKDGDKTKQFFAELFGWGIDSDNPMNYGLVDPGKDPDGRGIAGGIAGAMEGQEGYVTVYVEVDDVEAAMAKAESLGAGRIFGPETIMPGLTIGIFAEPEGKPVGVLHRTEEARRAT